jgi:hypothetical protein
MNQNLNKGPNISKRSNNNYKINKIIAQLI